MTKFMSAKEARELSHKNKEARIKHYLDDIDKDRKIQAIKRKIEKAVVDGEDYIYVHFWTKTDEDRISAIERYFDRLGYDIFFGKQWCRVRLFKLNLPKPPKIYR